MSGHAARDRRLIDEDQPVQRVSTSTFLQNITQRMHEHQRQIDRENEERRLYFSPFIIFGDEAQANAEPDYRSLFSVMQQQSPAVVSPDASNIDQNRQSRLLNSQNRLITGASPT